MPNITWGYRPGGRRIQTHSGSGSVDRYVKTRRKTRKTTPVVLDIPLNFQFIASRASAGKMEAHGWLEGFGDFRVLDQRQEFTRALRPGSTERLRGNASMEVVLQQGQIRQINLYETGKDEKPERRITGRVIEIERREEIARHRNPRAELVGFRYGIRVRKSGDEVIKTPVALIIESLPLDHS